VFTEETDKRQVLESSVEKYRAAISAAIETYIAEGYKPGKVVHAVYGADNGQITIALSAKNINLGNYWTGSWRSVYTINVSKHGSSDLKGSVKIQVHYFEDGNVQLHSTIDKTVSVSIGNEDNTAKEISKAINGFETDFQNNLEEMYVNMHRNTFKAMRRFLPINRMKMVWSSAAHSLAQEVNKGTS
jgi:capping protein alpha